MKKTSFLARIAFLGASAFITFAIVTAAADHGLPADGGGPVLARAAAAGHA